MADTLKHLLWPDPQTIRELSPHQQDRLRSAFRTRIGVLAGTPGTGKTFTAVSIIKRLAAMYGGHQIVFAAPTGKAAIRGAELLDSHGLTIQAKTIHRLLEVGRSGIDGHGWAFYRDRNNPLPQMFYFVDEVSMMDSDLFAHLLTALPHEAHVLLIGDVHQLPPVGNGAPLRDLIQSQAVGIGELVEIRRNSGDIVRGCCDLKNGRTFVPNTQGVNLASGKNWRHIPAANADHQVQELTSLLRTIPGHLDPLFDVQVLCAVNEKGNLNRKDLNSMIQPIQNPDNSIPDGVKYAVGDKVICTANSVMELVNVGRINDPGTYEINRTGMTDIVANGELGRVLMIDQANRQVVVKLMFPARLIAVPITSPDGKSSAASFELAYAITCHKFQGSQAKIVISLLDDSAAANRATSREWHYTACSRAETLLVTIGNWDTLMRQSRRVVLPNRKTFLKEELQSRMMPMERQA